MPDITVSFTDAQWVRIVAASRYILRIDEGDVDATLHRCLLNVIKLLDYVQKTPSYG